MSPAREIIELLHRPPDLRRGHLGVHHHRGPARALQAADQRVSGGRAAASHRARLLSGREPQGDRRHGGGAPRAGDRRRRGHALHVLDFHHGRLSHAHGDLQDRRRHRPRAGAGAEPRLAGVAAPARRGAQSRRQHRQGLLQPHARRQPHLSQWPLRLALPAQLCGPQHQGRAGAASWHGRRAGVRRRRLLDAGVARSAEARRA